MESIELCNVRKNSYTKTESLRALKTNLQFCGDDVKTILFTSSVPDEGKSTVTFDLARSLTESGKSVLLIDTAMKKRRYRDYLITYQGRRNSQMCYMPHRYRSFL